MRKIIVEPGGWPEGISDGPVLPCSICGRRVNFDFGVSDVLWESVVPEQDKRNVLCLSCLDELASRSGLNVADHLKFVHYAGIGKTIVLKPDTAYHYTYKISGDPGPQFCTPECEYEWETREGLHWKEPEMKKCEICGMPQKDDLFSAVTQDPVCSICKLKYIGGLPTTPKRIEDARKALGLEDGEYLDQDNPAEARKILGRS